MTDLLILCPLKNLETMTYPGAVRIPGAQIEMLKYHFPLEKKEQVELNHEVAITKSSPWVIRGQMTGFFKR